MLYGAYALPAAVSNIYYSKWEMQALLSGGYLSGYVQMLLCHMDRKFSTIQPYPSRDYPFLLFCVTFHTISVLHWCFCAA